METDINRYGVVMILTSPSMSFFLCFIFLLSVYCIIRYCRYHEKEYYKKLLIRYDGYKINFDFNTIMPKEYMMPYTVDEDNNIHYICDSNSSLHTIGNIDNEMFLYVNNRFYVVSEEVKQLILDRMEDLLYGNKQILENNKILIKNYKAREKLLGRK